VRSSGAWKGCLVAVLVVGGLGFMTCFAGFIWAWQSGALEEAAMAAESSQAYPHQSHNDAPSHQPQDNAPAPPMPNEGLLAAGCYAVELEFESTRDEDGHYGDWEVSEERSRAPVPCSSVRTRAPTSEEQQMLADWPSEMKVLRVQTLSSLPQTPGDPFTRRKVLLVHMHVPGGAP
jgi:hypothetical protein